MPFTLAWSRDSRDSSIAPTSGTFQRLGGELSPIAEEQYVRTTYQIQRYQPLNKDWTTALNLDLGYGKGLGGLPYPVFKNFYSGGLGSVRGFGQGSLGPRDVTGVVLGGTKKITLNAELIGPFPGTGNDRTIRWYAFADAGNVWGDDERILFTDFRASAGVGLSWLSPMGPLRLAIAKPIRKQPSDRIERYQFQIGSSF